jgi:LPXTG-motif cell wall-anchored protein
VSSRALVIVLIVVAIAFTLPATITGNSVLGWLGAAAFVAALVAYVRWRREVRRGRVLDR